MKIIRLLFIALICNLIYIPSYSLEEKTVQDFLLKVEKELSHFDSTTIIKYTKINFANRKIHIYGQNNLAKISFKQRIKQFKSGLKKEVIKIYKINPNGSDFLIYKIVKLNNSIYYVRHFETILGDGIQVRQYEELFYDNKCYQKTTYNSKGRKSKTENIVLMTQRK